ncbi:MAG: alpha/beta hydrolase [Actinomycetota bacterium]|nr:alpha/beta hydrolase [Actinomycetota bacterium]
MPEFRHQGRTISYDVHGEGERPLVLVHGLLLNRHMFDRLAPAMAARGNRVLTLDLLGHGSSARPPEMVNYSMALFGQQVVALLDHLEIDRAVIGGTSLGANTTLTVARDAPERMRGMMVEMPVLDNALLAVSAFFTPILLALRFGEPLFRLTSSLLARVPRTHPFVDLWLDTLRQDPRTSAAVLEGLFLGAGAPHHDERVQLGQPALVIGHRADPVHPFSDSGMLVEELPNSRLIEANSILEWRLSPQRLDDEFAAWLDDVWEGAVAAEPAEAGLRQTR